MTLDAEQVIVWLPATLNWGTAEFDVTAMVPVMLHPFAGEVIVNVYIPAEDTAVDDAVGVVPAGVPTTGPVQE